MVAVYVHVETIYSPSQHTYTLPLYTTPLSGSCSVSSWYAHHRTSRKVVYHNSGCFPVCRKSPPHLLIPAYISCKPARQRNVNSVWLFRSFANSAGQVLIGVSVVVECRRSRHAGARWRQINIRTIKECFMKDVHISDLLCHKFFSFSLPILRSRLISLTVVSFG